MESKESAVWISLLILYMFVYLRCENGFILLTKINFRYPVLNLCISFVVQYIFASVLDEKFLQSFERVRCGSMVKFLTRNAGVLGTSHTGSTCFFFSGVSLGKTLQNPFVVLVKPRKGINNPFPYNKF